MNFPGESLNEMVPASATKGVETQDSLQLRLSRTLPGIAFQRYSVNGEVLAAKVEFEKMKEYEPVRE